MKVKSITLYTNNLTDQYHFYKEKLEFPVQNYTSDAFEVQLRQSLIRFERSGEAVPYHFAINIPSNKAAEALDWLQDRVQVLSYEGKELIDFSNWNALAMYFYDADHNIVEFICRKNLRIEMDAPFTPDQLIELSEIGVVVEDIPATYSWMKKHLDISIFDGNFDRFCAVGDEHGLFIVIDKNKKDWFPKDDTAHTADFLLEAEIKGKIQQLKFSQQTFSFFELT